MEIIQTICIHPSLVEVSYPLLKLFDRHLESSTLTSYYEKTLFSLFVQADLVVEIEDKFCLNKPSVFLPPY
jgi:hypothetical protein